LAVRVPFLRGLFSFGPLHLWEIALVGVASLTSIMVAEGVKLKMFSQKTLLEPKGSGLARIDTSKSV
jgi:hypothetical protein